MRPGKIGLVIGVVLAACNSPVVDANPPELDFDVFQSEVYPVLARDCAFPACHGTRERFFQVYAPGRVRLDPTTELGAAPTMDELMNAYDRARSALAAADKPENSIFLRKPLEASAGGSAHMGTDAFGRNVYRSTMDPNWITLLCWARGEDGRPCP
jgi:hypothetical protein